MEAGLRNREVPKGPQQEASMSAGGILNDPGLGMPGWTPLAGGVTPSPPHRWVDAFAPANPPERPSMSEANCHPMKTCTQLHGDEHVQTSTTPSPPPPPGDAPQGANTGIFSLP